MVAFIILILKGPQLSEMTKSRLGKSYLELIVLKHYDVHIVSYLGLSFEYKQIDKFTPSLNMQYIYKYLYTILNLRQQQCRHNVAAIENNKVVVTMLTVPVLQALSSHVVRQPWYFSCSNSKSPHWWCMFSSEQARTTSSKPVDTKK